MDPKEPAPSGAGKPKFLTKTRFDSFDLPTPLLEGLKDAGFSHCSPIQADVLPVALAGKDVAGQAQTGTGKTAAFLVPLITKLLEEGVRHEKYPSAIIVAPTRELAIQIYEEAEVLTGHTDISLSQVLGGMDYKKQADDLIGGTDVVIGTPGRIIDYYKQKIFVTDHIKVAVIDEADRLLDLGFAKDMRYILRKLPHFSKRQTMLFSATMSYRVLELTYEYMHLPEFIAVAPEEITVKGIEQELHHVGMDEKLSLLLGLLKREEWTRMLIFVNTKSGVEWLTYKLKGNGFPAGGITGDLPQKKRLKLMQQFKDAELSILVATDVASRGIHVEDISHVVNYDIPQDPENYIHRIGRTARAGKTGRAITLASENYIYHLEPLEEMLGFKIPIVWAEPDWHEKDHAGTPPRKPKKTGPPQGGGRGRGRTSGGPGRNRPSRPRRGKPTPQKEAGGTQPAKRKRRRPRKKKPSGNAPSAPAKD